MPLDSTWQIIPPGGTALPAASLGISELVRHRRSLSPDTVTATVDGRHADAAALFAYGATVTVLRGSSVWFLGRVTQTPASGSGTAQSQSYTLSGPWWYLDNLSYRQPWKFQLGAAEQLVGRLILGQDVDGTYLTTGAVITEALQYAIAAGAPFQIGATDPATRVAASILPGYLVPLDEVKDVTCAEVFRKMARWHPDAVAWFDYATTPPTLAFQAAGTLTAATLTVGAPPLAAVGQLTPRHDLQAPAVVIHYEVASSVNGAASTSLVTDAAPATATGTEFGAVVLTIPLRGSTSTTVQQRVQTAVIQDTAGTDGLLPYLSARYAPLAIAAADPNITANGITFTSCTRGLSDPNLQDFDPDTGEYGAQAGYDATLGNELVAGAVTDWMVSQYNVRTQAQRIIFQWTEGDDAGEQKQAAIDIIATNAVGQVYTSPASFHPGDVVPTGLAAAYLATVGPLQWSGTVELAEGAAGATVPAAALGSVLNLAGSANAAWAAMNALIVGEETRAATGRTTLTLGPATHLSPQDLVARLQLTRPGGVGGRQSGGARSTRHSDARTSGAPGRDNNVPGATAHPKQNGTSVPGSAASPTPLSPYKLDDTHAGVTYGTVCGGQPGGFAAGGAPPFSLAVGGTGYLYATATYDFTNLIWTGAAVVATGNPTMANTSTVAYALIGSYTTDGAGHLTVVSALAGNVDFDPCALAEDNGS